MSRQAKVHKRKLPYCGFTVCGVDVYGPGVLLDARKQWRGVTCKNCLRKKPQAGE